MNRRLIIAAAALACASWSRAQTPGNAEDNGLSPVSETFYVNPPGGTGDNVNNLNKSTESIGVAIARNGNVLIGFENDGDALTDMEAVWTMYGNDGKQSDGSLGTPALLTPEVDQTSLNPEVPKGMKVTSHFLSFFRGTDLLKDAIPGFAAWGPKIKANPFGDGVGMGATAYGLGVEIASLTAIQNNAAGDNAGDFPAVQLLNNNGEPLGVLSGVPDDYAERDGDIRIGDWDYLGNGNIVIVGESRQRDDLTEVYHGEAPKTHGIVRIVDNKGAEKKSVQLLSETATEAQIWHGIGVTKTNFAVRFQGDDGRAKLRFFDNAGNVTSTNIDLGTLAGNNIMALGGRGDGVGFHGNGNDAFVAVAAGADANDNNKPKVWVTVINANGTLRWSKSVSDDLTLTGPGRCDAAIDSLGRVVVAYPDKSASKNGDFSLILARVFDAKGTPVGKTFAVSEKETADSAVGNSDVARVAFRNDIVAIAWISRNSGTFNLDDNPKAGVVALRTFVIPVKPGSIESAGLKRIVPDTAIINQDLAALGNWEPYASVLGNSTFLIEGNAFADGTSDLQRFVVALQPAAGGPKKTVEGFYGDNGKPYNGQINLSRQNGNPGRVAGDQRPGAVNYMVGGEASPHAVDAFNPARWNTGFDRLANGRYGTVQTFKLDVATLTPTPLHNAIDSANGRLTTGAAPDPQITRFGGDIVCLNNGHFVSAVEDRSRVRRTDGNAAVATIFNPDGSVVKDTFLIANGDYWSNLASYKDGFAVRVSGNLYFFNNEGVQQGDPVDQATSGESYDRGRGDGTRIAGHINSPYLFLAGKVANAPVVRVSAWDTRTRTFVATAEVSEGGFRGDFDRATVTADAYGRIVVAWVAKPDGYEQQQVAARVLALDEATKTIKPLTSSFLPFVNNAPIGGIHTYQMSVAMTTKQILVAAKGEINLANKPELGATSPNELNFYTVISHPDPKDYPAGSGEPIKITGIQKSGANVTIQWTGGTPPFSVQKRSPITGTWQDAVANTSERTVTVPASGTTGFFRINQ